MSGTYHIRVKKEYAAAIIEDLQKMDAVEILPEEEAFEIPRWQQEEVNHRISKYKKDADDLIDEDTFLNMLNEE